MENMLKLLQERKGERGQEGERNGVGRDLGLMVAHIARS